MRTGMIGGRREHVDDRAAHPDLAAVLDLVLAPIARVHQRGHELVAVAPLAVAHLDRFDLLDVGAEPLDERADRRDDDIGRPFGVEQPPDRAKATTHRLDPRAHPLERQRLPRREQIDAVLAEVGSEVVREPFGVGGRRHRDDVRAALRRRHEAGEREGPSGLGYGDERGRTPPNFQEGGVFAEQCGQVANAHQRTPHPTARPLLLRFDAPDHRRRAASRRPLHEKERDRVLFPPQLPDRLSRVARAGRLLVGPQGPRPASQLGLVVRSAAASASARRRAAGSDEARGHRHVPADRARHRRDDGEPLLRQLLRDARPRRRLHARGRTASRSTPTTTPNGKPLRAFHMANTCQLNGQPSQNWNASHTQCDNGANDGFVRSASGPVAMGYWDGDDIPFYYGLANTFPLCDRWFCSVLAQTYPNRRFLLAGTALGTINNDLQLVTSGPQPPNGTIMDAAQPPQHPVARLLHRRCRRSALYLPVLDRERRQGRATIDQFFTDAAAGTLPAFCLVEPDFDKQSRGEPAGHLARRAFVGEGHQRGDARPGLGQDAAHLDLRRARRLLRPRAAARRGRARRHPADAAPTDDPCAATTATGSGCRRSIVSPYAKRDYVSHVVHDHTSILSLVETSGTCPR